MNVSIKMSGERELSAALIELSTETGIKVGRVALAGAGVIRDYARENIFGPDWLPPKDPAQIARRTGNLKRSIHAILEVTQKSYAVATVVAEAFYAAFVEFGTSRMAARSYLRKAIFEHKKEASEAMREKLVEIIAATRGVKRR